MTVYLFGIISISMRDPEYIQKEALALIESAEKPDALEALRVNYLGKSGVVTLQMKQLASLPPDERKAFGAKINAIKNALTDAIDARAQVLRIAEVNARLEQEWIDVTLPPRPRAKGFIHPISKVLEEVTAIFAAQGFEVAEGPEIEDDYHNFTALNFPPNHPARQMHDTFFLRGQDSGVRIQEENPRIPNPESRSLLRTHTSPVQIRTMQAGKPPFRFIAPGKTFRCDSDLTHTPMFHQVEGFVIDRHIHMGHLKGCVEHFLSNFFELDNLPVRFRPSFFPFTEPSAEVDIGCTRSKDEIKIGPPTSPPQAGGEKGGWLEIMGCGMVHPHVLKNCNIDPTEWQGFAFGVGVERLAMLKYGIPDLRTFFESDIRWLEHYGFSPLEGV